MYDISDIYFTNVGFLKGKSAIAIVWHFGRVKNFTGEVFWARGYFVSTAGLDEATVRAYIRNQEREDEAERIAAALGGSWFASAFEALTLNPPALPEGGYLLNR